jgi:HK97 gp10 family phage protein
MADAEFKLDGIEELVTNNGRLVMEMGPIIREMLEKSIRPVERRAKQLVPVDTGRLRSSLASQIGPGQVPEWAEAGTNVNYARFVEFGTKYMKAQPYLMPALEQSKPDIDLAIEEATKKIEETWQ